jgi:hypothetical protein
MGNQPLLLSHGHAVKSLDSQPVDGIRYDDFLQRAVVQLNDGSWRTLFAGSSDPDTLSLRTQTMTKSTLESSDKDAHEAVEPRIALRTKTLTYIQQEQSDIDQQNDMDVFLGTKTATFVNEETSDKDR